MNQERIQQLLAYVTEEPGEPFNVYALGMEYLTSQPTQAQHYFDKLLLEHPTYLPTYYQAAQLCAEMGHRPRAATLYEAGITLAQAQSNRKIQDELTRALRALQDEDED